jgi:hypothetical protein
MSIRHSRFRGRTFHCLLPVGVRFGSLESKSLALTLSFSSTGDLFYLDEVNATGWIDSPSTDLIAIVLIIDDDLGFPILIGADYEAGETVLIGFTAAEYDVSPGPHSFAFYAVDYEGNVAEAGVLRPTVIAPSASRSRTPTWTRSPSPYATQTPAPLQPLFVGPSYNSFDIFGVANGLQFSTSMTGYRAVLDVGGTVDRISDRQPVNVSNVFLSFNSAQLTPTALLLVFKLFNAGAAAQSARFLARGR